MEHVDLTEYLLDLPDRPIMVEGPRDVLEAMNAGGYPGEWWFEGRPLNEGQFQTRRATCVSVSPQETEGEEGDERGRVDLRTDTYGLWAYNFRTMIVKGRLPIPDRKKPGQFKELKIEGASPQTATALMALHPRNAVLLWLQETLTAAPFFAGPESTEGPEEVEEIADLSESAPEDEPKPEIAPESDSSEATA